MIESGTVNDVPKGYASTAVRFQSFHLKLRVKPAAPNRRRRTGRSLNSVSVPGFATDVVNALPNLAESGVRSAMQVGCKVTGGILGTSRLVKCVGKTSNGQ